MSRLIAFAGPLGSGKSTAAGFLVERGFVRTKFAAALKRMLLSIGLTIEDLEDPVRKMTPHPLLCGKTPREAMQRLGTEWGRDLIHPDLWVTLWGNEADNYLENGISVLVDDMRFRNELLHVRKLGGSCLYIRPRALALDVPYRDHPSEDPTLEGLCDVSIDNSGSLDDLRHAVINQVRALAP